MRIESGHQCECTGEGCDHTERCKAKHNQLAVDWRGTHRIIHLRKRGDKLICGRCSHRIAARAKRHVDQQPPKQRSLF